jgi:hypothetical protein
VKYIVALVAAAWLLVDAALLVSIVIGLVVP